MHAAIARAKRLSFGLPKCRSRAEKRRLYRVMRAALFSALPPKKDGSHPLDADRMTLEVL